MVPSAANEVSPRSPSLFRLVAAGLASYIIAFLLLRFGISLDFTPVPGWFPNYETFFISIQVIPMLSVCLVQWLLLRRWISRGWLWFLVSAVGLAGVIYGGRAFNEYAFQDSLDYYSRIRGSIQFIEMSGIDPRMQFWTAVSGASIGLACGLILALLQSLVMKQARRRWWGITAVIWIFIGAGLAYAYAALLLS